ncbi:winged helix-turn-helix transcriptional regulator [Natronosalvus vescus]|uniref:winged helix-turn-helix transcriptional regulator n=1 Tax=Natronosalvus vescus TaxID=2953881 RepID=UPI002090E10C|nr:helix-turn-helix domain-containing protein [Natronosalvus vescus]
MGLTAREARDLRESLSSKQRKRLETTVEDLLSLFGKAHAIAILSEFAFVDGPLRFSELESSLDIAANTLSVRLQELTEAGLLVRQEYNEVPPRVQYEPTPKAEQLFPAFRHFHVWAINYELDDVDVH